MALIKCNECGQMVSDKASNCPKCGAPIDHPIKCEECGETVPSLSVNCPKCGAPIKKTPMNNQPCASSSVLKLNWEGKYAMVKTSIEVIVNGQSLGEYSYNDGFEIEIPIQSTIMDITLRCNSMKFHVKLSLAPQENYTCKLYYSSISFFYYELYNSAGSLIKKDKLGIGMYILCFLIPLVGFIYYFVKKNEYPGKAKAALLPSFIGLCISILQMIFL